MGWCRPASPVGSARVAEQTEVGPRGLEPGTRGLKDGLSVFVRSFDLQKPRKFNEVRPIRDA